MGIAAFVFYAFALSIVVGGLFTVISRSPVHAVLWLILTFISAAGLFVRLGAEFVAMLLVMVYVGAVAVLFLFVVMMLDADFAQLRAELATSLPIGLLIAVVILMQLLFVFGTWDYAHGVDTRLAVAISEAPNTRQSGDVLYDRYILPFQLAGLILLVAMIGAIVLTLRHRTDIKRQNVVSQILRDPAEQIALKDVKPGQGL